jgi:hypothetical protein
MLDDNSSDGRRAVFDGSANGGQGQKSPELIQNPGAEMRLALFCFYDKFSISIFVNVSRQNYNSSYDLKKRPGETSHERSYSYRLSRFILWHR